MFDGLIVILKSMLMDTFISVFDSIFYPSVKLYDVNLMFEWFLRPTVSSFHLIIIIIIVSFMMIHLIFQGQYNCRINHIVIRPSFIFNKNYEDIIYYVYYLYLFKINLL